MSLRISSVGFLILLAGCGGAPDVGTPGNTQEIGSGTPAEAPGERIACAVGDAEFAEVCTIERSAVAGGNLLTIRQPTGGFRRLLVAANGDVQAADGAQPVQAIRAESATEVTIGDERYRLPPK